MAEWATYNNSFLAPCLGVVTTANPANIIVKLYPTNAPSATVTIPCLGDPASYGPGDNVLVIFRGDTPNTGVIAGIVSEAGAGTTAD